ncbi:hypothetical protein QCA50_018214 [Cerrena zonata]|uniref:UTP23 sensor motif region domain-containing protein n=1 Tax=Cerrena zonata TaxID=2478898 RepID=A0AAW0FGV8_9APHY
MSIVVEERRKQREIQKEVELKSKLRIATERILNKNSAVEDEVDDELEAEDEEAKEIDINQVDDEIKPVHKHKRSDSNKTTFSIRSESTNAQGQESYLNYFFGKDPVIHQQHLQTQAQLNPTPFKFPHHQEATLQFNNNFINNGSGTINSGMKSLNLDEQSRSGTPLGNGHGLANGHAATSSMINGYEASFESDDSINELSEREQLEFMVMEPLSHASSKFAEEVELRKLTGGLNNALTAGYINKEDEPENEGDDQPRKKRKGPKGPNPLSIKKKKPDTQAKEDKSEQPKKRRRKHHKKSNGENENPSNENEGSSNHEHEGSSTNEKAVSSE